MSITACVDFGYYMRRLRLLFPNTAPNLKNAAHCIKYILDEKHFCVSPMMGIEGRVLKQYQSGVFLD